MADQFTSVEERGLGDNLMASIKGVASGALLFILSFVVLWWNEGRADLSAVAKKSSVASPERVDSKWNGKFISVTGPLATDEKVGDPDLLEPGSYLRLHRNVEMFAWVEHVKSSTEKKVGGGSRTERTVTYTKEWSSNPKRPNEMEHPKGHANPPLRIKSESFSAKTAKVAAYPFSVADASLPVATAVKLTPDMVKKKNEPKAEAAPATDEAKPAEGSGAEDTAAKGVDKTDDDEAGQAKPKKADKKKKRKGRLVKKPRPTPPAADVNRAEQRAALITASKPDDFKLVNDQYLFQGTGSLEQPDIGDVRVSFSATVPDSKSMTLFGVLDGETVRAYKDKEATLLRVVSGSRDEAIQALSDEHKQIGWFMRLIGFLMMWFGLNLFFGPVNALLDIVPFLGSAGRMVIGIATLPIAIVLSLVTIILSIIAHSPILLVLVFVALGAGGFVFYQRKAKKKAA